MRSSRPEDLAEALEEAVGRLAELHDAAESGTRLVGSRYTWDEQARAFELFLRERMPA